MTSAAKLYNTYRSYFGDGMLDEETRDKIFEWIDRDFAFDNERIKQLEQQPRNAKMIIDWSGSAKQLLRILNLRAVADYEERASEMIDIKLSDSLDKVIKVNK